MGQSFSSSFPHLAQVGGTLWAGEQGQDWSAPYSGCLGPGQTTPALGCLELIQKSGFGLEGKTNKQTNFPSVYFINLHKPREQAQNWAIGILKPIG